eukprot:XP_019077624.1 PREDICTED: uncharacterized protein LOC109123139 [Vitis vinifera]
MDLQLLLVKSNHNDNIFVFFLLFSSSSSIIHANLQNIIIGELCNNSGEGFVKDLITTPSGFVADGESNTSQRLCSVLLNEFNYLPWSRAVTIALGGRSKLGFINGKEKAPVFDSPEYEIWLSKDQLVMSWILNSMERNIAEIFSYSESSLDLWEALRDMYGNQNNSARIFQIQQEVNALRQDGRPFVSLLGNFKSLWSELEVYRPHTSKVIQTHYIRSSDQLADAFTKVLSSTVFHRLMFKLGSIDPLAPA